MTVKGQAGTSDCSGALGRESHPPPSGSQSCGTKITSAREAMAASG